MFMRQGEHLHQLPTFSLLLLFFHTPILSAPNRRVTGSSNQICGKTLKRVSDVYSCFHIENFTTGDPQEQVPLPSWDHYLKVRNDAELAKVGNRLQTSYPLFC